MIYLERQQWRVLRAAAAVVVGKPLIQIASESADL